jgi:hypothetical protein
LQKSPNFYAPSVSAPGPTPTPASYSKKRIGKFLTNKKRDQALSLEWLCQNSPPGPFSRNQIRERARQLMADQKLARTFPQHQTWDEVYKKYNEDYNLIIEKSKTSNPAINEEIARKKTRGEK